MQLPKTSRRLHADASPREIVARDKAQSAAMFDGRLRRSKRANQCHFKSGDMHGAHTSPANNALVSDRRRFPRVHLSLLDSIDIR
jgi:hypothetical protein